ncbi:hypothetical protein ElyMa_001419500 [Elysia marginata]|uniref:C-type lectin domain-containing protein n=1 Tax=Elysia marginata TaxID=1093978 RepID=A0AAV4IV15_9GAST|nr:hypothetical protein ElyMa_001419500 [Elysia marginata]
MRPLDGSVRLRAAMTPSLRFIRLTVWMCPMAMLGFLVLAFTVLDSASAEVCPDGWNMAHMHMGCIRAFLEKKTWLKARKACQERGADLMTVPNRSVDIYFKHKMPPPTTSHTRYWIGLHNRGNGKLHWLNDTRNENNNNENNANNNDNNNKNNVIFINDNHYNNNNDDDDGDDDDDDDDDGDDDDDDDDDDNDDDDDEIIRVTSLLRDANTNQHTENKKSV